MNGPNQTPPLGKKQQRWLWIGGLAFVGLWILFFDSYSILNRRKLIREIKTLEAEVKYYDEKSKADSTMIENLKDDEFLETYGREHFFFRKEGETVYLIEE